MTKKRKGKHTSLGLAGPDDPIYKEGLTISTPRPHRSSTPPSPKKPPQGSLMKKPRFPKVGKAYNKLISSDLGPPDKRLVCPPPELVLEDEYPLPDTWLESAKRAKIKPPAKPKPKADK